MYTGPASSRKPELIAHESARDLLVRFGRRALEEAREHTAELMRVEIRLPKIIFNEGSVIRLGDKTAHIMHAPGPGPDVCVVHVREEKVLFASDLMMPVPVVASPLADIEKFKQSLHSLHEFNLETIVQGHGDILLRGEVTPSIEESIQYLNDVEKLVDRLVADGAARRELLSHDIEEFGRSRIALGGLVQNFHQANLLFLLGKSAGCPEERTPAGIASQRNPRLTSPATFRPYPVSLGPQVLILELKLLHVRLGSVHSPGVGMAVPTRKVNEK